MKLLDGRSLSNDLYPILKQKISKYNKTIKLVIYFIGESLESSAYIKMKSKKCAELGITCVVERFTNVSKNSVKKIIESIRIDNRDDDVHGIMVQLPLPFEIYDYTNEIINTINVYKDVDGLTNASLGNMVTNTINIECLEKTPFFISSTIYGVLKLIDHYNIEIEGKNVVVIGNSSLIGLPVSIILSKCGATVEICHIYTDCLKNHTINKDIVISGCGVIGLIKEYMISDNATIIDIGISVEIDENGKRSIHGDCDFESVKDKCNMITPVPGGVGPMTIYSLIEQLCKTIDTTQ